jgi:hypothetical protein
MSYQTVGNKSYLLPFPSYTRITYPYGLSSIARASGMKDMITFKQANRKMDEFS